ncbi:hypothetical protein FCL40_16935 [Ferrimonas sediminicola]|uniref:Bro-N domain-containing protein n=1 Tax=Ferrimonas sediminicola TaxID=2569538 RepID=A0A4U1B9Z7_9GAMM|nr:hypothetical protein [Ferrimonas sediminicola]TKB46860.1 hypothetical protein FCL40_16935 [Ferrimonas sediminicola]
MDKNRSLIEVCYQGEAGQSNVRTQIFDGEIYVSLSDTLQTLSRENAIIDPEHRPSSLTNRLKRVINTLEADEYRNIMVDDPRYRSGIDDPKRAKMPDTFINQTGYLRVLAGDTSEAGKRFQRWLFRDVIPTIYKHGEYPAPVDSSRSLLEQSTALLVRLAEDLNQNVQETEQLKRDMAGINDRLTVIESVQSPGSRMISLNARLLELEIKFNDSQMAHSAALCDKLRAEVNGPWIECPKGGSRYDKQFEQSIVDTAIKQVR